MTHGLQEVDVRPLDVARLESLIGRERMAHFERVADEARVSLAGRAVLNVNSTATGGGVAEMLQTLLAYVRGAGIDTRWLVIRGDPDFFAITKRIHNGIYGSAGDGGPLGDAEREHYERVLALNRDELIACLRAGDTVLLHDPQPVGLAGGLKKAGARVVWRCHIGCDERNEHSDRAWEFIRPYVEEAELTIVSRDGFAPPFADPDKVHVIPPSIDPFSAKNEPISRRNVLLTLAYVGLLDGDGVPPIVPFTRRDGSQGTVGRRVSMLESEGPPPADAPLVVQASRWDPMKDMEGVMQAFSEHVDPRLGAHLLLAGPTVEGVADDPEASLVYRECAERWQTLDSAARSRIHLASIPMDDTDENAAIVNALQRHAAAVVQKSIAEGFGLTVTEAMWKARPVVASAVGGITEQIEDGRSGLLVEDPLDLAAVGLSISRLLTDPRYAADLGSAARQRVLDKFLGDRHLEQYAAVFRRLAE